VWIDADTGNGTRVQLLPEERESKIASGLRLYLDRSSTIRAAHCDMNCALPRIMTSGSAPGLFLTGAFSGSLLETVLGATQESNSRLPHVRADIAEYKRGSRVKLNKLMINRDSRSWPLRSLIQVTRSTKSVR
jgi:hypothetical protein